MSRWTHTICLACWNVEHPDREPVRFKAHESAPPGTCCKCAALTREGIYVRRDPETLLCKGECL